LPLPVAMRIELARSESDRLTVRVAKERRGRVSGPRSIVWTRPRAKPLKQPRRQHVPA
jgi:recombination protein RecA